ncbi:hypothetical protein C1X05_02530 [Laceyella sacchari]|nr:hypothetical protein C1X05_02530 [Laceyella sacchari]
MGGWYFEGVCLRERDVPTFPDMAIRRLVFLVQRAEIASAARPFFIACEATDWFHEKTPFLMDERMRTIAKITNSSAGE